MANQMKIGAEMAWAVTLITEEIKQRRESESQLLERFDEFNGDDVAGMSRTGLKIAAARGVIDGLTLAQSYLMRASVEASL
jgi:hypothetical protein